ncbi:MAG: mandelate racemase/muconate lactonizing protein, partial [uncultured bacterium]
MLQLRPNITQLPINGFAIEFVDAFPLNVPLKDPFVVASTRLDTVQNVAVRVGIGNPSSRAVGWGEIPTLHPITPETQPIAMKAVAQGAQWLVGQNPKPWFDLADGLKEQIPEFPAVRAGIEMAIFDAALRAHQMPVAAFFDGGLYEGWTHTSSHFIRTDITVPICTSKQATELAYRYAANGFTHFKVKVGNNILNDVARIVAIRKVYPACTLFIDANEGYDVNAALTLLNRLKSHGIFPTLFEQPISRLDHEGMQGMTKRVGRFHIKIAADESCRTVEDVERIKRNQEAHVINIKFAKSGLVDSLRMIATAGDSLELMIGGMVETRLLMGFSAQVAAALGCFHFVDLDSPHYLSSDPISGGARLSGAT